MLPYRHNWTNDNKKEENLNWFYVGKTGMYNWGVITIK
jgi:hypothetical protein